MKPQKMYRSPDGTEWNVQVQMPGSSNAIVLFRHPDGSSSHRDRYNWFISTGPEARSVTTRLSPDAVMEKLDPAVLTKLFSRSMAVSRPAVSTKATLGL